MINLYVDGGSKNNGMKNQKGSCCLVAEDELIGTWQLGSKTNNEAELIAVEKAFEYIKKYEISECVIWSDSKLVVNLLNGSWRAHNPRIAKLRDHLWKIWPPKTMKISLMWMPREKNKAGQVLEFGYIVR